MAIGWQEAARGTVAFHVFEADALTTLAGTASTQSEDEPMATEHSVMRLYPVAAAATRNPVNPLALPGMVAVPGRPEIQARQRTTPDDLLRFVPGVEFTGRPRRTGEEPSIRGLNGADVISTMLER